MKRGGGGPEMNLKLEESTRMLNGSSGPSMRLYKQGTLAGVDNALQWNFNEEQAREFY